NWLPTQPIPRTRRRLSETELRAWEAFLRAYATTSHVLERAADTRGGLPLGEHFLLVQVARGPETGTRPTDLAAHSLLTKSGITRALDRLEDDGLVARRICPSDKRGSLVVRTPNAGHVGGRRRGSRRRPISRSWEPARSSASACLPSAPGRRKTAGACR